MREVVPEFDIAIPGDIRLCKKEKEKFERYQELKREIKKMWNIGSIMVISVVALGEHLVEQ